MIDTSGMSPEEVSQVTTFEFMLNSMPTEALELLHRIIGDKIKESKKAARRG